MNARYFCTLFDCNYLFKGVTMLRSLVEYCPDARVHVLCMDVRTRDILTRLDMPFITCILLADVEDEELLEVKKDRGLAEYCWTLSSWFTWHVLQTNPAIDFITYLDADLLFYSSVEPIYEEIGSNSIAIIEHRFTPRLKKWEVNGIYCVEWVSFRRDEEGMACLFRWREQCLEWCYYRLEDDRMGDQKYLDVWPQRYQSCHIIKHAGAGIAPWNYAQYEFGHNSDGNITVEGEALIFYHFHQFQLLDNGKFDRLSSHYTSECAEPADVYEIYESALGRAIEAIQKVDADFSAGFKSVSKITFRRWIQRFFPQRIKEMIRRFVRL